MILYPHIASTLLRINRRSGTNPYMTSWFILQSHTLSSNLFNRNPITISFTLLSDGFEMNSGTQATPNGSPNNSHSPDVPSANGNNRILIVDDDKDIATFFKLALDRAGFVADRAGRFAQPDARDGAVQPDRLFRDLRGVDRRGPRS